MKKNGFTLVEILIAIGLTALFLPALVFVFSLSLKSAGQGESYTQAYTIAQQQMEAIYYLKENDSGWKWEGESINNTIDGNDYYQPSLQADGSWNLGFKTDSPKEMDGHTATVKILRVYRDDDLNITEDTSWDIDDYTRKVIVNVAWKENGIPTEIDLVSYVSRH